MLFPYLLAFCRVVIGFVFTFSGLGKVRDVPQFVRSIAQFDILPQPVRMSSAVLVIVCECAVALAMLIGGSLVRIGFVLAVVLLVMFSVVLLSTLRRRISVSCNCFGANKQVVSFVDVGRNVCLIVCACGGYAVSFATGGEQIGLSVIEWGLAFVIAAFFSMIVINIREIVSLFQPG